MPWAMIDFSYFEHVFDGTTLLLPLVTKSTTSTPIPIAYSAFFFRMRGLAERGCGRVLDIEQSLPI